MNKLIDGLFERDAVIKVISVLTAILIWFLVLDKDNPFEERTIAVPLTSNVDVLQANNLQIVGTPLPTSIDVKIRGRRQRLMGVTANDFKAAIDLSGVTESGTMRIRINTPRYMGDEEIMISSINPSSVNLRFERVVGKQYPVELQFQGKLPPGYELVNVKVDPDNVILEERESSISKVGKVVAMINLDDIQDKKELVMRGTVLDADGQPLRQFEGKVPLIVSFDLAKHVPVLPTTKGYPLNDWYLKEIKPGAPDVRIVGPRSVLDSITKLSIEPVDITGSTGTYQAPLTVSLPKGASVLKEDADLLFANVMLERYATRAITIPTSKISIYGSDIAGNKEYRVAEEQTTITIKGRVEDVNAITESNISCAIQVEGLLEGEHQEPLLIQVPDAVSVVGEYTVKVVIV
ncbi:MAG: CdaR family protein, partial [Clostridia bacterium]|nr:CdaR family protein [Clostridia bacterium]